MEFYLKLIFIQLYVNSKDTLCYAPSFFHGIAAYILYHAQPKKKTPQFQTS